MSATIVKSVWASEKQLALAMILLLSICSRGQANAPQNYEFINGKWFDGQKFAAGKFYAVGGKLTTKKPARIDKTFDLTGKFVVPPFGEAHNHNITSEYTFNTETPRYFQAGIFYARMASSIAPRVAMIKAKVNLPGSLDVVFGSPGLTTAGGHPEPLMRRLAGAGVIPGLDLDKLEGATHFAVDSIAELGAKWPTVLDAKPDFIKTLLLFSTEKDKALPRAGLRPEVYKEAVKLAHSAGLRVMTHVETAADFALAIEAGADEIAHLPGYSFRPALGVEAYQLDETVARQAAQQQTVVVTTCIFSRNNPQTQEQARAIQIHNLRLLHQAGVRLAIGSDVTQATALDEAQYLRGLGVFDNLTLLKMWCETTAATIFPARKIGHLKEGYEASFLVLSGNPLEDFANVQKIEMRVKQGEILQF